MICATNKREAKQNWNRNTCIWKVQLMLFSAPSSWPVFFYIRLKTFCSHELVNGVAFFIFYWWTASIKPRQLFSPCKLSFLRNFLFSQIYTRIVVRNLSSYTVNGTLNHWTYDMWEREPRSRYTDPSQPQSIVSEAGAFVENWLSSMVSKPVLNTRPSPRENKDLWLMIWFLRKI